MIYWYIPFLIGPENQYQSIDLILVCLQIFWICVHHFPVDLLVSESKVGGVARNLLILLNCNLSNSSNLSLQFFIMWGSFSCWSDIVRGKDMVGVGCRRKPVDFVEVKKCHMCASLSCWSDSVRGKSRGVSPETCWFVELQFVFGNF